VTPFVHIKVIKLNKLIPKGCIKIPKGSIIGIKERR